MRAIQLNAPASLDNLCQVERDIREPKPGELRVKIHACSLNYHDYCVVTGVLRTEAGRIPMSDGAGVIEAVGEGVTNFSVGDKVVSVFFPNWETGTPNIQRLTGVPGDHVDGFAAESVTYSECAFTKIPDNYNFQQAATLPTAALTAWRALMVEARVAPGDKVLVQGTGGVSIFALQFAKAAGCEVIATSSSDEKLERLKALGADHVINYKQTPEWGAEVLQLTQGKGVNVVVEVGGAGTLKQSIAAVAFGGNISLIGVLDGFSGDVSMPALFSKNATISGVTVGSRDHQLAMINAINVNNLEPVISHTLGLEEIGDAFRLQASHGHFGKICLSF